MADSSINPMTGSKTPVCSKGRKQSWQYGSMRRYPDQSVDWQPPLKQRAVYEAENKSRGQSTEVVTILARLMAEQRQKTSHKPE